MNLLPIGYWLFPIPYSLPLERSLSLSRPYVVAFSRRATNVPAHRGLSRLEGSSDSGYPTFQVAEPYESAVVTEHDVKLFRKLVRQMARIGLDERGFERGFRRQARAWAIATGEKSTPVTIAPWRTQVSESSPK